MEARENENQVSAEPGVGAVRERTSGRQRHKTLGKLPRAGREHNSTRGRNGVGRDDTRTPKEERDSKPRCHPLYCLPLFFLETLREIRCEEENIRVRFQR